MSVVMRRYLARSRLAEALVEDLLMVEHSNAMLARDVEELVAECLELEEMSKKTWNYVLDILFADEQDNDIDDRGQLMKTAVSKILEVFAHVKQLMERSESEGHSIKGSADFLIGRQQIIAIKNDVEEKFPPIDEAMVAKAMEDYQRGAYQSSEDLLRESQAQGS